VRKTKLATPAQEVNLIEKATVKSNPAASAGVSSGDIINPKKLVKAVAPPKKKRTNKILTKSDKNRKAKRMGEATAAAVEAVKFKVRSAAKKAAEKAAKTAVKKGLNTKQAKALVRKAARTAAKQVAANSHSMYVHALRPKPKKNLRKKIRKKELSIKTVVTKKRIVKLRKFQHMEVARKKKAGAKSEKVLKTATKRTLAAAVKAEKSKSTKSKETVGSSAAMAKQMRQAQLKALAQEAKAWKAA